MVDVFVVAIFSGTKYNFWANIMSIKVGVAATAFGMCSEIRMISAQSVRYKDPFGEKWTKMTRT